MKKKGSILKILGGLLGLGVASGLGAVGAVFTQRKVLEKGLHDGNLYKAYYRTLYEWVEKKNDGKSIVNFFNENNYNCIAIYGMGTLGELLYNELKDTKIKVSFWIDRDATDWGNGIGNLPVISIDEINTQQKVDAVIITPITHFYEISDTLESATVGADIISLEEVVHGI